MTDVRATLALAREQQAKADFRSAERSLLLALEAATQLYSDPALVAEALQMLTAFYRQTHQMDEAAAQATWAAEILKGRLGNNHPALAPVYKTLAELCQAEGFHDDAQRYLGLAKAAQSGK
jgi:hypothetical protein